MYRTDELRELMLQGIPDSLRNELWLTFSGAIYDVSYIKKNNFNLNHYFVFVYRKQRIRIFIENVSMNHHS